MTAKKGRFKLTIPFAQWGQIGNDSDPTQRLLAHIVVNGCDLHLEAIAVIENDDAEFIEDRQVFSCSDGNQYDSRATLAIRESADFEPVQTAKINGRNYALIATPFQR